MPCLILLLAALLPRVAIVLLFLVSDYLHAAYESVLWPILGFLFMPYTMLAYAFAMNEYGGVQGGMVVLIVVAVIFDLASLGGGGSSHRRRR